MNIVDGVVMGFIDAMFENGTSIQDFIEKTPLCFINMTKAQAIPFEGYIVFAIQPMFDHEGCKKGEWSDWTHAGQAFYDQFNLKALKDMLEAFEHAEDIIDEDGEAVQQPKLELSEKDVIDLFANGLKGLFDGEGDISEKLARLTDTQQEFITS